MGCCCVAGLLIKQTKPRFAEAGQVCKQVGAGSSAFHERETVKYVTRPSEIFGRTLNAIARRHGSHFQSSPS